MGRPIYLVSIGAKARPAVLLTRPMAAAVMTGWTFAPITSTIKGISTEVMVGPDNGLDHESVISCDNIRTVDRALVGPRLGELTLDQEVRLSTAIRTAFDLL